MAVVTIPNGFWWPKPLDDNNIVPTFSAVGSMTVDGYKFAQIIEIPKTGNLKAVGIRTGVVINNPDNGITVSFQDLDASGDPDGTADQYRNIPGPFSSSAWYTSGIISSDGTDGGAKRAVTRGQMLAVVLEFTSFVASDNISWGVLSNAAGVAKSNYNRRWNASYNGVAWTKSASGEVCLGLMYDDDTYVAVHDTLYAPSYATGSQTINTGTTPDEYGIRFVSPFTWECDGAWVRADFDNEYQIVLYNSSDSVIASYTVGSPNQRATANGGNSHFAWAAVTLTKNQTYRLVVKPTSASSVVIPYATLDSAALLGGCPAGASCYATERADAGAWTDTNTEIPYMGLHIGGLEEGSGGGGAFSAAYLG